MTKRISLCALLYGDHPDLAHRCLNSIWERLSEGRAHLFDIRLGLNQISASTRAIVDWFTAATRQHYSIPLLHYDCRQNACKYPLMRRMLLHDTRTPADFVMWFDDDSYLDGRDGWWSQMLLQADRCDMLGKIYHQAMRDKQWEWISHQAWFDPTVPPSRRKGKKSFRFATGGWWVVRAAIFRDWDWPTGELKHCGGDSMLGELLRHQNLRLHNFDAGVRINADKAGRHSKATPRGESWHRVQLGSKGWLAIKDLSHHNFTLVRRTFGCD